ncbi:MAG: hypothetical protein J1F32_01645 [Erysipelotrichales bacterium]|nr:hypothetical protein [Erysipelotrichales bacterium]
MTPDSNIKFDKGEKLKFFLRLLLVVFILIILFILKNAYQYSMSIIDADMSVLGKTFFTDDIRMIYEFDSEHDFLGTYYQYEFDDEENIINREIYYYTYEIDSENYLINVDFLNPELEDTQLYFVKDGLLDITNNIYFYEY